MCKIFLFLYWSFHGQINDLKGFFRLNHTHGIISELFEIFFSSFSAYHSFDAFRFGNSLMAFWLSLNRLKFNKPFRNWSLNCLYLILLSFLCHSRFRPLLLCNEVFKAMTWEIFIEIHLLPFPVFDEVPLIIWLC